MKHYKEHIFLDDGVFDETPLVLPLYEGKEEKQYPKNCLPDELIGLRPSKTDYIKLSVSVAVLAVLVAIIAFSPFEIVFQWIVK